MKKECEHEWKEIEDTTYELAGCGETLERPVKCVECGKTGREVWVFSTYIED